MAKKTRISFTVNHGDVDNELRSHFMRTAKSHKIPVGKLLSRAMYLAFLELDDEIITKNELDRRRESPLDPEKPLNEDLVVDSEIWVERSPWMISLSKSLRKGWSPK